MEVDSQKNTSRVEGRPRTEGIVRCYRATPLRCGKDRPLADVGVTVWDYSTGVAEDLDSMAGRNHRHPESGSG
jgi:hypothetical protein